jgi:hypothetical protein
VPFGRGALALPPFDPYRQPTWHVDVYDRGRAPFAFTARAESAWVHVEPAQGTVTAEQRLAVSVDWSRAPAGTSRVPITITGPNGSRAQVQAVVANPAAPRTADVVGFVESPLPSGGYVSMEAEHYARAVGAGPVRWQRIPDLGRTLSGMTVMPVTAPAQTPGGASPRLEYRAFLFDTGTVSVHAYLSPTLDFTGTTGLRYAVSLDDEPPQVVNIHADGSSSAKTDGNRAWEQSVANEIKVLVTKHHVAGPGAHVLKFWMVDPGVVLQKLVIAAGELPESYLGPPESFHREPTSTATRVTK